MEKDFEIYRGKKERIKSISLKAKKESRSGSDDEEYAMAIRNFKKFFRRKGKLVRQPREENKSFQQRDEKRGKSDQKCFRCGDLNHLIDDCPKPSRNKDQKAFIGGSWSDSENDAEDKTNDETCLMAQSSNDVTLNSSYYSDNTSSFNNDSLGFDSSKASTNGTKIMSFVESSAEKATDESTMPGFVSRTNGEIGTNHVFSPPMSSRSDYVITKKKLIHNRIDELKKPSLKPSLKSGIGYVKTESRPKTPPPRRIISSQPRHNTPQP
nr:alpha/beta hydrolases superfamily protein [Tanacetum cinerariifolium]